MGTQRAKLVERRVLVIDDGDDHELWSKLPTRGFFVEISATCDDLRERCERFRPEAILFRHCLCGDEQQLSAALRGVSTDLPLVFVTTEEMVDHAVRAARGRAAHFLLMPVEIDELSSVIEATRRSGDGSPEQRRFKRIDSSIRLKATTFDPFVGTSAAVRALRANVEPLLRHDRPVLLLGETGTGKSVLARWLHENGPRAHKTLVDLNCAGLSRELLDAELFGYERGAFTGATSSKTGLFELAHGGTLFLDEMGDMDPSIQPKLLKALEERRIRRLGDVRDRQVDLRLVSATHQDLAALVRTRAFRSDLYYRISAFPVTLPPLRERREDMELLANKILGQLARESGVASPRLSAAAIERLRRHDWPGNLRQLRNVLDRALHRAHGDRVEPGDLSLDDDRVECTDGRSQSDNLREMEVETIARVLVEERWRIDAAARRLGIPRSTLYFKIRSLGLRAR